MGFTSEPKELPPQYFFWGGLALKDAFRVSLCPKQLRFCEGLDMAWRCHRDMGHRIEPRPWQQTLRWLASGVERPRRTAICSMLICRSLGEATWFSHQRFRRARRRASGTTRLRNGRATGCPAASEGMGGRPDPSASLPAGKRELGQKRVFVAELPAIGLLNAFRKGVRFVQGYIHINYTCPGVTLVLASCNGESIPLDKTSSYIARLSSVYKLEARQHQGTTFAPLDPVILPINLTPTKLHARISFLHTF